MAYKTLALLTVLASIAIAHQPQTDDFDSTAVVMPIQTDLMIEKVMPTAVRSKNVPLEERFSSQAWRVRGNVTLWYDAADNLVSAEVNNNPVDEASITKQFEDSCTAKELY